MESKLLKSAVLRTNNIKRPYPTLFYFPGIRSHAFWGNSTLTNNIKSLKLLENNYKTIKEEYLQVIQTNKNLENDYKYTDQEKYLHQGDWEWYSYISKGRRSEQFKTNFPKTYDILETINNTGEIMLGLPFSYCFFSKLAPGSKIAAHYGPCNIRLRIHLGIDVPQDCYISVGGIQKTWEQGKCLAFDDTYIHEVENKNLTAFRTILLLDIWHPDILIEEREAIMKMFNGAYEKGWLK
jgi:aspartyl/asparaginyl beta-hydroxylase (cupin superfamily)